MKMFKLFQKKLSPRDIDPLCVNEVLKLDSKELPTMIFKVISNHPEPKFV